MPTTTESWRAAVVVAVTNATDRLVAFGKMTPRMFDDEHMDLLRALTVGDDATLMRCLKHYCPDDLQAYTYPGPDHHTTTLP